MCPPPSSRGIRSGDSSTEGSSQAQPRDLPQRAPPAGAPSCPRALSSPRAWARPASEGAVLPPPNTQRGSSQPAGGTSFRSQAPGQRECQSKGNSRRGRGLSQLGLVRQGPSSKGQSRMRVASPGGRAGRQQPGACRDPLLYPGHHRPPGHREAPQSLPSGSPKSPASSLGHAATRAPPGRSSVVPSESQPETTPAPAHSRKCASSAGGRCCTGGSMAWRKNTGPGPPARRS